MAVLAARARLRARPSLRGGARSQLAPSYITRLKGCLTLAADTGTWMPEKEATARIKINKLLEVAGWRFFQDGNAPANIRLEPSVTIKATDLDALGADFEKAEKGYVDFLLLDVKGFPLIVLEAKAEDKNPLAAKEQARRYARSQDCRFVILSNGNLHYFWDLERGNPYVITSFPTPRLGHRLPEAHARHPVA